MPSIDLQQSGPIARLLIDHPRRRNALTRSMWRALPDLVHRAIGDPNTRLLTLQSAHAGFFAAGADISEFESTYGCAEEARVATREIQAAVEALDECPLPVVALIDGACVGGGVSLALACDVRCASDRASFSVTPARLGLSYHPDDLQRLMRVCGFARASELLFTGKPWSAEQAMQSGLVNRLWTTGQFNTEVDALIDAITQNSTDALRAIKQGLRAVAHHDAAGRVQAEQRFVDLFSGPDFIEGRDAFLQKRAARFPSHPVTERERR